MSIFYSFFGKIIIYFRSEIKKLELKFRWGQTEE